MLKTTLTKRADQLYRELEQEVGASTMDLIHELVKVEIELKAILTK